MFEKYEFHHIGYAVKSIEETAKFFLFLGYTITKTVIDPIQRVHIAFLLKEHTPCIELVQPIDDESPVVSILQKNGVTPYHICYEVEDINEAISEMRKQKFIPLFNPVPALAFDNRLICYFFNKNVGLIELLNK
ncbi:MAG: hypothetical protein BWY22_02363 [Bacteroidetes bacterium ADurb.Bin217]|nr:MAG: hypothetical protein BWY22_02363 [Bacteroidetes bacterium ADurb.Bin217]